MICCWSGGLGQGADPVPGGHDHRCPGPGGGDFEVLPTAAAGQAGGGVQDAVAQFFGLGAGEVAVEGEQPQPGEQGGGGQRGGEPGAVDGQLVAGKFADPGVFAGADGVLNPCVNPVGGVDIGGLAAPAGGAPRQVGDPQGVP